MAEHIGGSECGCWGCVQTWNLERKGRGMGERVLCDAGCEVPVEATGVRLCRQCTEDFERWKPETLELLPSLLLIARGEEVPFMLPNRKGQKAQGSQPPMNLTAWVLMEDLSEVRFTPSAKHRVQPEAGRRHRELGQSMQMARDMVLGEVEDAPSTAYVTYRLSMVPPVTASEAEHWFQAHLGIALKPRQVYNWRDRGRLYAAVEGKPPRYRVLDIFKAYENRYRHDYMADTPGARKRREVLFSTSTR